MKGHVRRRGTAWELRAYVGRDPVSKRHKYVTRTFRGGKREADEALARLITEVSGGGHSAQDTTLGDLIDQWLDLARDDLSPSTIREYERSIRSYIKPSLGELRLARLKTAQLDRLYGQLRERGGMDGTPLAPATVRQTHAILRRALHQGMRWGWIATNPASLASPPRVRPPQLDLPNPEDVIRLIEVAASDDPDLGCFILLAASTGARRGELCALRWSDFDLPGKALTIARSIAEAGHSKLVEKDTKTHAARRIALDVGTVRVLRAHRERCEARASKCDVTLPERGHVFSRDPDGKRPWVPNDATKEFIRIRGIAGLDAVRLHDLRHFAATRLLAEGVPVRTVSGRLGHANAATTLGVYAHFVEESDKQAAATLGAMLTKGRRASAGKQTAPTPTRRTSA